MQRLIAVVVFALAAPAAVAADYGLKPGLWEVRVVKQVVDGSDVSAQLSSAATQIREALKALPADQRGKVEAAMRDHSLTVNDNGSYHVCISPEAAKRELPAFDNSGSCAPAEQSRVGNTVNFTFSCDSVAGTIHGTGEAVIASERVNTKVNTHSTDPSGGQHEISSETEMHYLTADCGNVKPHETSR